MSTTEYTRPGLIVLITPLTFVPPLLAGLLWFLAG